MPPPLAMIADDLSGACDTSVEFLGLTEGVAVVVESDDPGPAPLGGGLIVWNTESRRLAPGEARAKARRAAARAAVGGARILFKKTDSAFRGHFGLEIGAVMDELDIPLCCVAPAIPEAGRVTRHGIQYIDGAPIAETFYRRDPLHPVRSSSALAAAELGSGRRAELIGLEQIRRGQAKARLEEIAVSGAQIAVADAEKAEDLKAVVEAVLARPGRLLFVGGQGLARALAICLAAIDANCDKTAADASEESRRPGRGGSASGGGDRLPACGIAVFCGTLHPRSRAQLAYASRRREAPIVEVRPTGRLDEGALESQAARAAEACAVSLERSNLALAATGQADSGEPQAVETLMARTAEMLWARSTLSGLVLTGGSTAYAICRRLGVRRLAMRRRLAATISLAEAPELRGAAVAVKGGSLGAVDALDRIIEAIRAEAREGG